MINIRLGCWSIRDPKLEWSTKSLSLSLSLSYIQWPYNTLWRRAHKRVLLYFCWILLLIRLFHRLREAIFTDAIRANDKQMCQKITLQFREMEWGMSERHEKSTKKWEFRSKKKKNSSQCSPFFLVTVYNEPKDDQLRSCKTVKWPKRVNCFEEMAKRIWKIHFAVNSFH